MSEPRRLRIDVSNEAHAQLETEARRQGISVRDLIDRIVLETLGRGGRTDASQGRSGEAPGGVESGSLMTQLMGIITRFDALVARLTVELPATLATGFDTIKETISNTGGTGHLRTMLSDHDKVQTTRLKAMATAQETADQGHVTALKNAHDSLILKLASLGKQFTVFDDWRKQQRKLMMGSLAAVGLVAPALFVALTLLLADTPPTRWYAVRLTGVTSKLNAGAILAGDGKINAPLMAETAGLLTNPEFRDSYARCIDRAKLMQPARSCRIVMPRLLTSDR